MTRQVKDVATSVHNRLLNLSKPTGRPFKSFSSMRWSASSIGFRDRNTRTVSC